MPEGLDALVLAQLVAEAAGRHGSPGLRCCTSPATTGASLRWSTALTFFAPNVRVIAFPAWDTVPYDRVGPNSDIVARRIAALARLALGTRKEPVIVLTTVNAVLQRVPPRSVHAPAMQGRWRRASASTWRS